jgi:hypothetical protein
MVLLSLLAACGSGSTHSVGAPATPAPLGVELIVRSGDNFHSAQDVQNFVDAAARHKVQTISLLVKQDEDGTIASGQTYYRSTIAPSAPGYESFDVLQAMLDAAHARSIRVRAWIPQFHDQVAARKNPAWQMMSLQNGKVLPYTGSKQREYFVDPLNPEVQAYELSLIAEVTGRYAVDGVMLDWIRFDNYNMDLGDGTRARYLSLQGVDPLALDFSKPSAALAKWNSFRTDGLAQYVKAVRSAVPSAIDIGVYILPPEFVEVGQDAAKFNASVNALAPMCYFLDWGYPIDWFWSSCLASTAALAGQAEIAPAVDANLSDAQYAAMLAHLRSDFPQIKTIAWFQHGLWTEALMARLAAIAKR